MKPHNGYKPRSGNCCPSNRAGKTYIPAYDVEGRQWTMQTISEDGQKRFEKGGRKEGCFHVVGGQEKIPGE
jgi:phage/plasmid primase-like uncharacterized protein